MQDYTADLGLADIKLLAVDMDLTLLADDGTMPENMAERIEALDRAGVVFCPASGRPVPTLAMAFPESRDIIGLCGDNGGNVQYRSEAVYQDRLNPALWREVAARADAEGDNAQVLCCYDHAVCLERDRAHYDAIFKYYKNIRWVDSYDEVDEKLYATNAGREWIDFMNLGVSKGAGIAHLCEHLGIDIADAAAVGDTYNDIPMLERVGHSFIVDNAEEHMNAHAKWRIPSNNDGGVLTLIDAILAAR